MSHLIDTNVAVHMRDGNAEIVSRIAALPALPRISLLTWIELEGGVYAHPRLTAQRRSSVDDLIRLLTIEIADAAVATAYGRIVAALGFRRPLIIDRMIAATAIVHDLTLITINGEDFRDIPGLSLEVWPHPAA